MRHNRDDKRFNRPSGHLRCMMANMTNSLFLHGRISTTTPKAKALRRVAERMVTLGKKGDLPARRRAMAFMRRKDVVTKLFSEIAPQYAERNGGYTRVLKVGPRPGDSAPMSLIELVRESAPEPQVTKKGGKAKAAKSAPETTTAKKTTTPKTAKSASETKTEKKATTPKTEKSAAGTKAVKKKSTAKAEKSSDKG